MVTINAFKRIGPRIHNRRIVNKMIPFYAYLLPRGSVKIDFENIQDMGLSAAQELVILKRVYRFEYINLSEEVSDLLNIASRFKRDKIIKKRPSIKLDNLENF